MVRFLICALLLVSVCLGCQEQSSGTLPGTATGRTIKQVSKVPKTQRIRDRFEQELEMTADPATGKIPANKLVEARKELRRQQKELSRTRAAIPGVSWTERGPNNVGGRTRTMMFDPNDPDHKKVWAGSVGGGLWYCDDITSSSVTWSKVDDFWDNIAISALAFDPSNTQILYAGTGEAYGNLDAIAGDGIWQSTDGGVSWTQLANTTGFANITQIIVLQDGTVLVGNRNNLRRSTNAGMSWSTATQTDVASLSIGSTEEVYLGGFAGNIEKSTDGGATWSVLRDTTGRRVEVAASLSTPGVVYGLAHEPSNNSDVHWLQRSSDGGVTWTNLTVPQSTCNASNTHFTRGQGWYDLTMIVHPTDANKITVGGVDCHTSQDGGNTWQFASNWYNCSPSDYVHADIHEFIIRPGSDNSLLVGCDGGVFYTADAYPSTGYADFEPKITDYNVTQFYHGDIHPDPGTDYILAGAQDNGTQRMDSPGIDAADQVTGGDGAFTHIDHDEPNIQISAYVYNNYWISSNGFGNSSTVNIGNSLGRFINPTDYDHRQNILYGVAANNQYSWVKGIGSPSLTSGTTVISNLGGKGDCIKASPNVTDRVYMGNNNVLLIIDDAQSSTPTQTALVAPVNSYMSCIEIEKGNEDHILITYSSYNVNSIWESTDGGANWTSIEGDLPNMPVRSIVLNPNDANQAVVATELGVWTTDDLSPASGSVDWDPTNSGLANVRTDHLRYRESDNEMIAVTHGRGVFSSSSFDCGDANGCHADGCRIGDVTVASLDCDATDDTYTAVLDITLYNTPSSGDLTINGTTYPFAYNQLVTTIQISLSGNADGTIVNLDIDYTDADCGVYRPAFAAPTPGCGSALTCAAAIQLHGSDTYNIPNIATGNGCYTCTSSDHAYWYTFTPRCDGTVTIASCGQGEDTNFYLYSSSDGTCNTLSIAAQSDDDCTMGPDLNAWASTVIDVPVSSGTTYYIEWDDKWASDEFDWEFTLTQPNILHVAADAVASDETGCSWQHAMTDLSAALAVANNDNHYDEIWVKAGTYYPGTTANSTFLLNDEVALYGGFDGTESILADRDPSANLTILSGDIGIADDYSDNCNNVVTINEIATDVVLSGFIIEKGAADAPQWPVAGGGIMCFGRATVSDCVIRDCISTSSGAAIYLEAGEGGMVELTLQDVTLSGNIAADGNGSVHTEPGSTLLVSGVTSLD